MYSDYDDTVVNTIGMYPVILYNFIRDNSDELRYLTVDDLVNHLQGYSKEGVKKTSVRKNVRRNLEALADSDKRIRVVYKNGDEYCTKTMPFSFSDIAGIYFDQPFSAGDIRILSDAIIYSSHLKRSEREDLLKKVAALRPSHSNNWYKKAIHDLSEQTKLESDLFRNLEYIDQAITEKKCIKFDRILYGLNPKMPLSRPGHLHQEGFTPYTIFIDDNTYYVIGVTDNMRKLTDRESQKHPDEERDYTIVRLPVHRLKKLYIDEEHDYLDIRQTKLNGKSLKEICDANYHFKLPGDIYMDEDTEVSPISENVEFITNFFGLDVMIETFGKKIKIEELPKEKWPPVLGYLKDLRSSSPHYLVTLKQAREKEWTTIISLLDRYPTDSICLNSHHDVLEDHLEFITECLSSE